MVIAVMMIMILIKVRGFRLRNTVIVSGSGFPSNAALF
jgi:hypothetical protein